MTNVVFLQIRFAIVPVLLALTMACAAPPGVLSAAATATPGPLPAVTVECPQEEVPPQITEIRPAQPGTGDDVSVIASGGFVRDTCGGIFEGSRFFKLYLDSEPVGELSCYVNHCEEQFTLPGDLSAGPHCLSVKADECQFEFQVSN